jgi:hypothetical protein
MTIEVGNDRVGVGGMLYSLARLGGNLASVDNPTDLLKMDRFDNPFIKFMYGKSAPLTGMLTSFVERKNYLGEPFETPQDYAKAVLERMIPFAAQPLLDNDNMSATAFASQAVGLRQFPESAYDKRQEVRDKVAVEKFGEEYKTLPRSKRNQVDSDSEIKQLTQGLREQGRDTPENVAWDNWNNYGESVEDAYQQEITLASMEFRETNNGSDFRNRLENAKVSRRNAYAMRAKLPEFETIQDYLNKPKSEQELAQMNPLDMATDIYYKKMYAPEMYDQFGKYDFEKADIVEDWFVRTYGQDALDEVSSIGTSKWAGTPELVAYNEAQKTLTPYFQIEDMVWAELPPNIKMIVDQIEILERKDPTQAKKMLYQYPQIVYARKQIALMKKQLKFKRPDIAQALKTWYSYG